MSSRKESKELRAEKSTKETAQTRRNFLRLGALGAAAVVAAGVLPAGKAHAQATTRTAKSVRSGGSIGARRGTGGARRRRGDSPQDAQHG